MTTRYYEETPCEHGKVDECFHHDPMRCPGGQRRELTGVEEMFVDAEMARLAGFPNLPLKTGRYAIIPLEED